MKNLRSILVFTCLGILGPGNTKVSAQEYPSLEKFPPGTYAIIHHPVTGAFHLVDLFAENRQDRQFIDRPDSHVELPVNAYAPGNAALACDARRGQLVYTGRSNKGAALWRHRLNGPAAEHIGDVALPAGHVFTKMAASPDGNIYALTTPVRGTAVGRNQKCKLVRITPGQAGKPASVRTLALLSGSSGFHAALMYSGDMAFSASGDLYIFGTAMDTTIQYYTGSEVFRIPAAALHAAAGNVIQVERLGPIRGMGNVPGYDSTVISGAAFLPDGRFILSVLDKATQQSAFLFVGRFLPGGVVVEPLSGSHDVIPPGFLVADLASRHFPSLPNIPKTRPASVVRHKPVARPDDWEQYVTIRTYQYE